MIKLSKLTDYAVVVLASMAAQGDNLLSAANLSEMTRLPEPTVSKILKILAKGGLVESVRGARGGYRLPRQAHEIMVCEVIETVEGPIALTSCVQGSKESCLIETACQLHGRWDVVNNAIRTALEEVTLADMMSAKHPCRQIEDKEVRV